jgi:uroporphyrinogen III methyltransferase / synthase
MGAIVDDIPCYRTVAETEDPAGTAARFSEEGADWITFTSGSTVEHFHSRFDLPTVAKKFPGLKLASIGPETTKAITALGLKPALEANPHTMEGMVKGLVAALNKPA